MHRNKEIELDVINNNPDITNIDDIRIKCCEREYTSSGLNCHKRAGRVGIGEDDTTVTITKCNCLYSNLTSVDNFIRELTASKVITKAQALKYTLDYTAEPLLIDCSIGDVTKFSVNNNGEII